MVFQIQWTFKFHVILLLNFISFYFVFYVSFDLFRSEGNIYYTKICEFFVGSSRPPYSCNQSGQNISTNVYHTVFLSTLLLLKFAQY